MFDSEQLKVALIANSMRSVDDRVTAPHMQIIRDIRKGLLRLGHEATIYGVSDGDTPTSSIIRSHWNVLKKDLEKRVKNESRAARQEMGRILEGLAFARETSHCVDAVQRANRSADVLHMHWVGHLFGALLSTIPIVYTMHYGWDDPTFWLTIKERVFSELPGLDNVHWVVLSRPQIKFLSNRTPRDHIHVVPHGLDYTGFPTQLTQKRGYVAFLGRMMRIKAPHLAIDAARRASTPIRVAGGFDPDKEGEPEYFKTEIEPRLGPGVAYLGELGFEEKIELLQGAIALLNPFQLEEPFGLVMPESLACGTPVIAPKKGSALEFIKEGENGFFAETVAEMADAIEKCRCLDCRGIQADVRLRFSQQKMVENYIQIYHKALVAHGSREEGA